MKFAFLIMGEYDPAKDRAEIGGGSARIVGVSGRSRKGGRITDNRKNRLRQLARGKRGPERAGATERRRAKEPKKRRTES